MVRTAFEALCRVGARGQGAFSDISQALLGHSRSLAGELGVLDRRQFVHAPADDLSTANGESVDAITTRSVLVYVADKRHASSECH